MFWNSRKCFHIYIPPFPPGPLDPDGVTRHPCCTRDKIWSQFGIIRKVFILIFPRISITHFVKQEIPIQCQHTIVRLQQTIRQLRLEFAHISSDSKTVALFIHKSKRLQQITGTLYRGWWANKNIVLAKTFAEYKIYSTVTHSTNYCRQGRLITTSYMYCKWQVNFIIINITIDIP